MIVKEKSEKHEAQRKHMGNSCSFPPLSNLTGRKSGEGKIVRNTLTFIYLFIYLFIQMSYSVEFCIHCGSRRTLNRKCR